MRQRLLASIICDEVNASCRNGLVRRGDDLFSGDGRKASVSIAAPTPVSVKIHFGLNLDPTGAPVPAVGLNELGIGAADFGRRVLDLYREEMAGIFYACRKVVPPS
jgi:hypothetical protein